MLFKYGVYDVVNILVDGDLAEIHRYKLSKVNYLLSSAWY